MRLRILLMARRLFMILALRMTAWGELTVVISLSI